MIRICLALNDDLKKQLIKEAKEKGLSLNGYIRLLLTEREKTNDKR